MPSQLLDLNKIEHLWDVVEEENGSMKVHLKNLEELFIQTYRYVHIF